VRRMDLLVMVVAVAIGATIGVQPVINARLGNFAGDPALAALMSTVTSTVCLLVYVLVIRPDLPSMAVMRSGPWWIWTGGLIGAVYVAVSLNIAQRLGATTLVAVVVLGQMAAALIVDHFGLLGLAEHPVSLLRILGVVLLIAGVALIRLF
jgi:transporter family-2 protein